MISVKYFVTDKSITLYWDKPYDLPEDSIFEVFADGSLVGQNKKTHYTLEGLAAGREYRIQIALSGSGMERQFLTDVLTISTGKEKRRILWDRGGEWFSDGV